ncbi:NifB/NifX family molybdenum-iron cluster-binding protein [Stutzerimonas kirkiae]|uniref:Nitrogen fixation protein NifX n=1 Tax=Stutzerimonas kirkiae TaxID=2211392 RepID=A0A4Q9RDV8_9GAMM|nr:NifB/NifX family molybdenum-iron cluster-binding protein [Stutzerimonas kirkiae]TBU98827.1 nitrogen fixation protein NifX [Stutzerimonas kirkiae]TBV03921.1 nitrogen fixation protein NifX [Stutzerimonas kirkiae]TBV09667.1 nitrogen fixation protein NifX [Stutzerimonas kirkiae]TBV16800.1 nitrogen fixation protein NifX [Stutzerimonas kirkiae]
MSSQTRRLQVLDDQDDGTLLRVAFASSDRERVDQHFGSSCAFAIYGVNPERAQLLLVVEFGDQQQDGNEDKLASKLDLLDGCIAVYCRACGASAVRQLLAIGVQPVKVGESARIGELLETLQAELREGPSAWLAKAIQRTRGADLQRFDAMAAEGWDE